MVGLGMALATKVAALVEAYSHYPKRVVIALVTDKLNETLEEMVLDLD